MIDFYIYGFFKDVNPHGASVKKVSGNKFDCCGQWWYYQTGTDHGKKYYKVTMPSNGAMIGVFDRLKDAKEYVTENFDGIVAKCSTEEWIRVEKRFAELVKEAER